MYFTPHCQLVKYHQRAANETKGDNNICFNGTLWALKIRKKVQLILAEWVHQIQVLGTLPKYFSILVSTIISFQSVSHFLIWQKKLKTKPLVRLAFDEFFD